MGISILCFNFFEWNLIVEWLERSVNEYRIILQSSLNSPPLLGTSKTGPKINTELFRLCILSQSSLCFFVNPFLPTVRKYEHLISVQIVKISGINGLNKKIKIFVGPRNSKFLHPAQHYYDFKIINLPSCSSWQNWMWHICKV